MGTCNGRDLGTPRVTGQAVLWGFLSREEISGEKSICISDMLHGNREAGGRGKGGCSNTQQGVPGATQMLGTNDRTSSDCQRR